MPLDFPTSPALNDIYTYNGSSWQWNGKAWKGLQQQTGILSSNIWAKQSLLIPKRGFGLNSGYNATTDQRRTKAGTIPMLKHNMERNLGLFYASNDPFFENVSLLLFGNGTNGSTIINDNSQSPKTILSVGNSQISTAQSKFYGSSILFDGTGDWLTVSPTTDLVFDAGAFTVEFWFYANSLSATLYASFIGV